MALVVTLILLTVTLVMAIAFLAVSRRERASVTTSTEITTARLAADHALAAAQSQILANILTTNAALYNYRLLVSTNYINDKGYYIGSQNPTNVNYDFRNVDGLPLNGADFDQNVANLMFLPRVPVLVSGVEPKGRFYLDVNRNGVFDDTGDLPFSVFADGTTNFTTFFGAVGDPQWVGILERPGTPHAPDNRFLSRYAFIALPVGESLDLNYIHDQVLNPTLVMNNASSASDGYFRNQGVGSWEINLAAFFADLNTNQWDNPFTPYAYNRGFSTFANSGSAFYDAYTLLSWRYNYSYASLASMNFIFGTPNPFALDNIDQYSDGSLQFTTTNIDESLTQDNPTFSWAGADNVNRFYTLSDFFDPAKSSAGLNGFTARLLNAGSNTVNNAQPTYDRYTFYRMLDQLGTDSQPDVGKMNLNYRNLTNGVVVPGMETNLYQWSAIEFFTNAAHRLLLTYTTNWFQKNPSNFLATYYGITGAGADYRWTNAFTGVINTNDPTGFGLTNLPFPGMVNEIPGFGLGNLPVVISNNLIYSPSINRLLQLAANIYDASGNNAAAPGAVDYPHVYRPQFFVFLNADGTKNIFITGYELVENISGGLSDLRLSQPIDVTALLPGNSVANYPNGVNVYGVPWIIGAKKYMPNFNAFYSYNTLQVGRKLQFTRTKIEGWSSPSTSSDFVTNQMLVMSVTNHMGFSYWNSYMSNFPSLTQPFIFAGDYVTMRLSSGSYNYTQQNYFTFSTNLTFWPGSLDPSTWKTGTWQDPNSASFLSGRFDFPFVHEAMLDIDQAGVVQGTGFKTQTFVGAPTSLPPFPNFELDTTNRFQGFILDNGHVVDYVQFAGPTTVRDLGTELRDTDYNSGGAYKFWSTNDNSGGLNWGVVNQIEGSKKGNVNKNLWKTIPNLPPNLSTQDKQAEYFAAFFTGANVIDTKGKTLQNTNLVMQAPFTPVRTATTPTILMVNDPLVHYLVSDMNAPLANLTNAVWRDDDPTHMTLPYPSLNSLGQGTPIPERYQPWGRAGQLAGIPGMDVNAYNLAYKDPLAWGSDNWDFPDNKYPSVGWLGRVHRGTPWQSVYLKATNMLEYVDAAQANPNVGYSTWMTWLGDTDVFDAANSRPIQDDLIFDVFTAAVHPNASRGTLSVNQQHLAAWSALMSGMTALTNITDVPSSSFPPVLMNTNIQPAGVDQVNSALFQIVTGPDGINATRANKNIFPNGAFKRIGDILRAPALTEKSPFINFNEAAATDDRRQMDISDELYEWLPQQMLGLVRVSSSPRFVVYAYGQTLKPAPGGTVLDSAFFGLVTNYQVVAESATRSVITVLPMVTNTPSGPVTNYNLHVENFNVLPPE